MFCSGFAEFLSKRGNKRDRSGVLLGISFNILSEFRFSGFVDSRILTNFLRISGSASLNLTRLIIKKRTGSLCKLFLSENVQCGSDLWDLSCKQKARRAEGSRAAPIAFQQSSSLRVIAFFEQLYRFLSVSISTLCTSFLQKRFTTCGHVGLKPLPEIFLKMAASLSRCLQCSFSLCIFAGCFQWKLDTSQVQQACCVTTKALNIIIAAAGSFQLKRPQNLVVREQ